MAYRHSQSQLAELEAANQALFQQTFPNIKRIVNIKAQAEQELLALQKQGGGNSSLYLRLLYQSGENLAKDQALQVQALEFTNGILSLHLTGSSIAQIETFKQSMEKTPGIRVNIQSAETGDQGLSAHLDISEQSS
jgi:general secretion pathway protein L